MQKLMILVTMLAMTALIGACAEEDENPIDSTGTGNGTMEATVDGNEWESTLTLLSGSAVTGTYAGTDGETSTITVAIGIEPEEGEGTGVCTYSEGESEDSKTWSTISGNFDITLLNDNEIQGTFEFTGTDGDSEKSVKGSFTVDR